MINITVLVYIMSAHGINRALFSHHKKVCDFLLKHCRRDERIWVACMIRTHIFRESFLSRIYSRFLLHIIRTIQLSGRVSKCFLSSVRIFSREPIYLMPHRLCKHKPVFGTTQKLVRKSVTLSLFAEQKTASAIFLHILDQHSERLLQVHTMQRYAQTGLPKQNIDDNMFLRWNESLKDAIGLLRHVNRYCREQESCNLLSLADRLLTYLLSHMLRTCPKVRRLFNKRLRCATSVLLLSEQSYKIHFADNRLRGEIRILRGTSERRNVYSKQQRGGLKYSAPYSFINK